MTFADWVAESRAAVAEYGPLQGSRIAALKLWEGVLIRAGHAYNWGESVYERDWDALIVLDACRPDLLREVTADYEFLPGRVDTYDSPASQSEEWMEKTFGTASPAELEQTAYVTGNPFSRSLDASAFARLDEVWRYAWDDEFGGIPPGPVTDRAITAGRETDADRLIVHYMQPHVPFRSGEFDAGHTLEAALDGDDVGKYVWYELRDGEVSLEELWAAYRDTLEWVLDSVGTLLSNLDAERVVITADHANAIGEWGVYEHPPYVPVPAVKRVPWVETTAEDTGEYEPTTERIDAETDESGIEERLSALGYK